MEQGAQLPVAAPHRICDEDIPSDETDECPYRESAFEKLTVYLATTPEAEGNDYDPNTIAVLATAARLLHQAGSPDALIIKVSKDRV